MKEIRYPNLYSKHDLETKFEALENAITDLIEVVEEIRNPEPSPESPKPDWVKEELADASKETIFRHLDLLESQILATTSDDDRINDALEGMTTLVCALRIGIRSMLAANRPSDDLLAATWRAAIVWWEDIGQQRNGYPNLEEWLKTIPPDTLKEDRELVKRHLSHEFAMGNGYLTIQTESFTESVALANALKRLCGMEVGNGK